MEEERTAKEVSDNNDIDGLHKAERVIETPKACEQDVHQANDSEELRTEAKVGSEAVRIEKVKSPRGVK